MKITADTNVLVRAITGDHEVQSKVARNELANADLVWLALPALCELVWVPAQRDRIPIADIGQTIRRLVNSRDVAVNRPAVRAGLAVLDTGGDFADGVMACEGAWLGAIARIEARRTGTWRGQAAARIGDASDRVPASGAQSILAA